MQKGRRDFPDNHGLSGHDRMADSAPVDGPTITGRLYREQPCEHVDTSLSRANTRADKRAKPAEPRLIVAPMLESGHCSVHPSREAHLRCRSCGKWLCDRCAAPTPAGFYCSASCRAHARIQTLRTHVRKLLKRPLDAQWTIAVTASLAALLLGGVGMLLVELDEISGLRRDDTQHPSVPHTARLIETERGWQFEIQGAADGRVVVVDRSGRSFEIELDETGRGRGHVADLDEPKSPTADFDAPVVPDTPTPTPTPTLTPTPTPTAIPAVTHARPTEAPAFTPTTRRLRVSPLPTRLPAGLYSAHPPAKPTIPTATQTPTAIPTRTPKPAATRTPAPKTTTASPSADPAPPILHLVADSGPRIAITFDGGASSNRTAELLDLLQGLEIEATLFLTGSFIRAQPALVRRAVLSGHEVGNHTDSHPHLTTYASDGIHRTLPGVTRDLLLSELERTEEAFRRATGRSMAPLWRAPYGEENADLRRWALEAGYLHVRWSSLGGRSLDTMDWIEDEHSPFFRDSRRIMDRLLSFPQLRGGIILMHLATDREEAPWLELPTFVAALRERSIEPVKVTTLLAESRIWRGWLERAARRHATIWDEEPEHPR